MTYLLKIKKTFFFAFLFIVTYIGAQKKIVITGGPGVGKTSVIQELKKLGYQVVPEVYTLLRYRAKNEDKLTDFYNNPIQTRWNVINMQQKMEDELDKNKHIFCDRSNVDMIGYADYYSKIQMPQSYFDQIKESKYDLVFFIQPLPEYLYKQTEIRKEDHKKSLEIHEYIQRGYEKLGYNLIVVPVDTVSNRIKFILDYIDKNLTK